MRVSESHLISYFVLREFNTYWDWAESTVEDICKQALAEAASCFHESRRRVHLHQISAFQHEEH